MHITAREHSESATPLRLKFHGPMPQTQISQWTVFDGRTSPGSTLTRAARSSRMAPLDRTHTTSY